jgi:hypothetical protein
MYQHLHKEITTETTGGRMYYTGKSRYANHKYKPQRLEIYAGKQRDKITALHVASGVTGSSKTGVVLAIPARNATVGLIRVS